jgi:hypothetical protein
MVRTMIDAHERLKTFSRWLAWRGVQEYRHVVEETVQGLRKGQVIRCWCSGSYDDVALHMIENPPWYASVFALRYRICTGWHKFHPYVDAQKLGREARRLDNFLNRRWFTTIEKRREFRLLHPECAEYSWRRLREEGPPYYYEGLTWPV